MQQPSFHKKRIQVKNGSGDLFVGGGVHSSGAPLNLVAGFARIRALRASPKSCDFGYGGIRNY